MNETVAKVGLIVVVAVAKPVATYLTVKALAAHANRKAGPRRSWRPAKFSSTPENEEVIIATIID